MPSLKSIPCTRFPARFLFPIVTALLFCLCFSPPSFAQSSFSGFVSTYTAYTTTPPHTLISGRNRFRSTFLHDFPDGRIYATGDLRQLFSASTDSLDFRVRELYLELFLDSSDLKIGKQIIVWGQTEGDFIFDLVSPFDLSEFLTQDFRELREGVTAVNYIRFFGRNQLQLIVNPAFEPSRLPAYDGPWGIVPTDIFPLPTTFLPYESGDIRLRDTQLAARFAWRGLNSLDLDVALMYWRTRTPAYFKRFETTALTEELRIPERVILEEQYRPSLILGFWGEYRPSNRFSLPFELAWFQERPFDTLPGPLTMSDLRLLQAGADTPPDLPVSEILALLERFSQTLAAGEDSGFLTYTPALKWMTGLRFSALGWNWSAQYVADVILRPSYEILQDNWFHGLTLTSNRSFFRDQLTARMLGRWQFNGRDFWINPELSWNVRDGLNFTGGAQLFGGESPDPAYPHLSFRQYGGNSLIYLSASWFF